ncbi:Phosphoglucomutase/phosphomannomutase [Gilbertella persicaria]|uniref:Phosphoglucomutase/phosphomannomutase n=1 Tax=Gilbertella persicaria TaxID=101096 RepID=UPI00221F41C3|nr:Phosphoglucomutase/phosphomannomutase [Gilbertella persicaria]KAI8092267.1 Phosphoglucomutase/phosphomannomutase [Gilbertella persicaria]
MEAGFSRMNDLTVLQASQGLAVYIENNVKDAKVRGVVVGHDHRHHSSDFARLTAAAFLQRGIKVWFYKDLVHTPLVPYTIKKLKAAAGVMITASHNPKDDNGYKVYWENACQIIPPHDEGIAASIQQHLEPWGWEYNLVDTSDLVSDPTDLGVIDSYFNEVQALCRNKADNQATRIKFVYTAMHGVGTPFAERAFGCFDLPAFVPVQEQVRPDPDFPTVAFPNPEEGKGALTLAIQTAERVGGHIILANDPDADRLAIAEKQPDGEWIIFTGNQIGSILGAASFEKAMTAGLKPDQLAMVASTVSSKFLARMAQVEGFTFEESLTGFKWIGNTAMRLEQEGLKVVFSYEEAIGFTIGDIVKDKDGVSALGFFAEWAVQLYKRGLTAYQYLEELYQKYGYFVSENSYFICDDKQKIAKIFERIRFGDQKQADASSKYGYKLDYPTTVGGYKVTGIRDLTVGYDSSKPNHEPTLPVSSSSEMITFSLENNTVFTIRTSGTEPKIKYYSELRGESEEQAKIDLHRVVEAIGDELMEYQKNGLAKKKQDI